MPQSLFRLLPALLVPMLLAAQADPPRILGMAAPLRIQSRVLGEERVLDVSLPRNYDRGNDRYPVLYVLDGEFEHEIAAAIARFYATMSQVPPMIVVGIRNTNRTRDFTPPPRAGYQVPPEVHGAGGADRFLDAMATEIIPMIERTYRTAPMRVLVGHSLGGLVAMHALATRPELFTGYVVMEPSLWWNDRAHLLDARKTLATTPARRARLMLVNAEEIGMDTTRWGGSAPMIRELAVTDETHESMAAAGLMQALRTMFADFKPAPWRPGMRPIAMLERYDSLAARVGYAPPIPRSAYSLAARMSLDSRWFDDAGRALDRMESALGVSDESRQFRARLASERNTPTPPGFVQLEIPRQRPSPADAARFLGRWVLIGDTAQFQVTVRASGDTIVVHDRYMFPNGGGTDSDDPVIQVTSDGVLEWGLDWFRGIAALLVLRGTIGDDGIMTVTRQVRGWIPRGPGGDFDRVDRFRRVP